MNVSSGVMNTSECRLFQLRFEEDLGKLPRFRAQRIGVGDWAEQPCSALCSSEDVCHFPTSSPTCFFGFARDSPLEGDGFELPVPELVIGENSIHRTAADVQRRWPEVVIDQGPQV